MTHETPPPAPLDPTSPQRGPSGAAGPRRFASTDLLAGEREILIEHAGEVYRLTLTRSGKLILHK